MMPHFSFCDKKSKGEIKIYQTEKNQDMQDVLSLQPIKKTHNDDKYLHNILSKARENHISNAATTPQSTSLPMMTEKKIETSSPVFLSGLDANHTSIHYGSREQGNVQARNAYSERIKDDEKETLPFLEGFNYYQKESEKQPYSKTLLTTRLLSSPGKTPFENSSKANQNVEKDEFLDGFNQEQEEEFSWKRMLDGIKNGVSEFFNATGEYRKELINSASARANEKGILDDATNAFFRLSDLSQDSPIKILPTNVAHEIIADRNYNKNKNQFLGSYKKTGGYIYDQSISGSQMRNIKYGVRNLQYNGCGIIAVNNALISLGNRKDIRDIARDFETDGQVLFGLWGTNPYAIGDYFRKEGYDVTTYQGDNEIYNLDLPDADTYVMSSWNSDKVTDGIHIVCMDKLPNGKYRIYNDGSDRTKDVNSLKEYFKDTNGIPLVLHCVKKGR